MRIRDILLTVTLVVGFQNYSHYLFDGIKDAIANKPKIIKHQHVSKPYTPHVRIPESVSFEDRLEILKANLDWSDEHIAWLKAAMLYETGGTMRADIRNTAGSGAIGLIQFMPSTAKGLGTSSHELSRMTPVQQLDYVETYFEPHAHKINSLSDVYMAILWPRAVDKPDSHVLFKGTWSKAYKQNKGLDLNKDGKVTKGEAVTKVAVWLNV